MALIYENVETVTSGHLPLFTEFLGLEQIGHLQCAFSVGQHRGRLTISKPLHLACHVGLISVSHVHSEVRQTDRTLRFGCGFEETLKTYYGLEHFRTVADGNRKTPTQLPLTDTD